MEDTPCTYRISVKAAIKDDQGRILLLLGNDDHWELPGGGLEHGEDPRQGLTREVNEETGMTVEWMSEQPERFWTIRKDVGSPTLKWFAFVVYEVKVSGIFRPEADEAVDAHYFTKEQAKLLTLHPNTSPYFSGLPGAAQP